MSTIRVEKNKENPYVMLNKTALDDENLSFKAKGIFAYLMSKPNDWKCQVTDLRKKSKDGADSIKAGLRELRENGYMIKRPIKNEINVIVEWEEILFETPQDVAKEVFQEQEIKRIASLEKRRTKSNKSTNGKSTNGKPTSGKPNYIINNNTTNNKLINNNTSSSSKATQGIFKTFEENICELKKTTFKKFKEVLDRYDETFLKAIIEECTYTNVKSYKGFEGALQNYVTAKCNTPEEVHQYAKNYSDNKKKNSYTTKVKGQETLSKITERSNTKKQLGFKNFDERKYDYNKLERQLLGWDD